MCDQGEAKDAYVRLFWSHVRDLDRRRVVADAPGVARVGDLEERAQPDGVVSDRLGAAAVGGKGDERHARDEAEGVQGLGEVRHDVLRCLALLKRLLLVAGLLQKQALQD